MGVNLCESKMADHQNSAVPPASVFSTQSRVDHPPSGKEILADLASICDSLRLSAGVIKDKESSRAGKNII